MIYEFSLAGGRNQDVRKSGYYFLDFFPNWVGEYWSSDSINFRSGNWYVRGPTFVIPTTNRDLGHYQIHQKCKSSVGCFTGDANELNFIWCCEENYGSFFFFHPHPNQYSTHTLIVAGNSMWSKRISGPSRRGISGYQFL